MRNMQELMRIAVHIRDVFVGDADGNGYEDIFASTIKISLPDVKDTASFSRFTCDLLKKEEIISGKAG